MNHPIISDEFFVDANQTQNIHQPTNTNICCFSIIFKRFCGSQLQETEGLGWFGLGATAPKEPPIGGRQSYLVIVEKGLLDLQPDGSFPRWLKQ